METKRCAGCGKELPVSEFGRNKRNTDGLQSYCRQCTNDKQRQSYQSRKTNKKMNKVYSNPDLAKFTPRQLIEELRGRGYQGTLQVIQKVVV